MAFQAHHALRTIAVAAIALLAGSVAAWVTIRASPSALRQPVPTSQTQWLHQLANSDPASLADQLNHSTVSIPAGVFLMGSETGRGDEHPQHEVYLDAFEMDRYEITNAQYRRFLQATGRPSPLYWSGDQYPVGQASYPVVGIGWDDANAYCTWIGKRLPTEAEWEKACRGTESRIYPWGDIWDPRRANVAAAARALPSAGHTESEPSVWDAAWQLLRVTPANSHQPGLRPVGAFPNGASPYGIMDLTGNASEWVADWYNWSDYSHLPTRNPFGPAPHWNHCLRGSPWHDPTGNADWVRNMSRCSARNSSHAAGAESDPRIGFRCARSVQ